MREFIEILAISALFVSSTLLVLSLHIRVTAAVAGVGYDVSSSRYGFFFPLRLCAEALTRGPGGLTPARDTHSCKETTYECSACSTSSHNKQNTCTSDALQSNMQHGKRGRFVSGGAYEGKQNTSGEQPDVLVSLRKAPSA